MAVTNDWGQASVNNTNGYGKGAINNTIRWGKIYQSSASGDTNIGTSAAPPFNALSTRFDGVDDCVNLGTPASLRFVNSDSFSFSAWVNVSSGNNTIISNQDAPSTNYRGYYFAIQSQKLVVILRSTLADRMFYNGSATLSSGWNHVAFTYDGSGTTGGGQLYVNGAADTTTGSGTMTGTIESVTPIFLGTRDQGDNFFDGALDEVSVFNTELSASAISTIYNSGTDLTGTSGLVSWWRMGDGDTFPTITDNVGSNNGTMTNMSSGNFISNVPT